jgi:hypothetical protein
LYPLGFSELAAQNLGQCTVFGLPMSEFFICARYAYKAPRWAGETCSTCLYFEADGDPEEACKSSYGPTTGDEKACSFWVTKEEFKPQTDLVKKLMDIREQYIKNGGKLLSEEEVLSYIKEIREGTDSTEEFDQFLQKTAETPKVEDYVQPCCKNCEFWFDWMCNHKYSDAFCKPTNEQDSCPSFEEKVD